MVTTKDVRNSFKEPGGYLKKAKNNDMVQAPQGIQPRFLGMIEHYQKGIGASRYLKEISEKAKKSLK